MLRRTRDRNSSPSGRRSKRPGGVFDPETLKREIAEIETRDRRRRLLAGQGEGGRERSARLKALKRRFEPWEKLRADFDDLTRHAGTWRPRRRTSPSRPSCAATWAGLEKRYGELKVLELLSGENDSSSAFVTIHSGAGGTEACDWVQHAAAHVHALGGAARLHGRHPRHPGGRGRHQERHRAGERRLRLRLPEGGERASTGWCASRRSTPTRAGTPPSPPCSCFPVLDDTIDVDIRPEDLRIDTYRAGGAGGQHVNKTDSAVRITHLPTGIVVQCQNERSQFKNKAFAMKVLRSRLYEHYKGEQEKEMEKIAQEKKDISWGNQIRSYTFQPYTLVKDHRTKHEVGNIQAVMDGEHRPLHRGVPEDAVAGRGSRRSPRGRRTMAVNVLIVDDLAFIKIVLRDILEKSGFRVVGEASNGEEAITLYQDKRPDVVLMDITMPGMDGLTALKKIREIDPAGPGHHLLGPRPAAADRAGHPAGGQGLHRQAVPAPAGRQRAQEGPQHHLMKHARRRRVLLCLAAAASRRPGRRRQQVRRATAATARPRLVRRRRTRAKAGSSASRRSRGEGLSTENAYLADAIPLLRPRQDRAPALARAVRRRARTGRAGADLPGAFRARGVDREAADRARRGAVRPTRAGRPPRRPRRLAGRRREEPRRAGRPSDFLRSLDPAAIEVRQAQAARDHRRPRAGHALRSPCHLAAGVLRRPTSWTCSSPARSARSRGTCASISGLGRGPRAGRSSAGARQARREELYAVPRSPRSDGLTEPVLGQVLGLARGQDAAAVAMVAVDGGRSSAGGPRDAVPRSRDATRCAIERTGPPRGGAAGGSRRPGEAQDLSRSILEPLETRTRSPSSPIRPGPTCTSTRSGWERRRSTMGLPAEREPGPAVACRATSTSRSPSAPTSTVPGLLPLEPQAASRDEQQKKARDRFYAAFGWFLVSLPAPLFTLPLLVSTSRRRPRTSVDRGDTAGAQSGRLRGHRPVLDLRRAGLALSVVAFRMGRVHDRPLYRRLRQGGRVGGA